MVRAPSATSIVVQYSTDNATWLDASPNPGFPNISTYEFPQFELFSDS